MAAKVEFTVPQPEDQARVAVEHIRSCAMRSDIRITQHAAEEMINDAVSVDDLLKVLAVAVMLEHYQDHRRGACCLVLGTTGLGRNLHVVCTTQGSPLIIITVYEPQPPKWPTPRERSR